MNWSYLIGGSAAILALLGLVYQLATRRSDATIKTLEAQTNWLEQQLEKAMQDAKKQSPDILADRLSRRVKQLDRELLTLSEEFDTHRGEKRDQIARKEEELARTKVEIEDLKTNMERAEGLLDDLEYLKEQFACPYCGAEITTLAHDDEADITVYACGRSLGRYNVPCPEDPKFPVLDDYEISCVELTGLWHCVANAITENGRKLDLPIGTGDTPEQAKSALTRTYEFASRNVPKVKVAKQ